MVDAELKEKVENERVKVLATNTVMKTEADRARLAREVLDFTLANG